MLISMILFAAAVMAAFLIHEAAHYLTARLYGHKLVFRRQGIRYVWDMPEDTPVRQRLIALSGFGAEILAVPIFYCAGLWAYPYVAVVHLAAYSFYAGDYSDFRWL